MYKAGDLVRVIREGEKQRIISISHVDETPQGPIFWDAGNRTAYYYEHELVPADPTPIFTETPEQIAERIVSKYSKERMVIEIIAAIETEREISKYYMTQMGRWVNANRR